MKPLPLFTLVVILPLAVSAEDAVTSARPVLPEISPADIVKTETHDLGGRTLILQEVTARALPLVRQPAPPAPPAAPPPAQTAETSLPIPLLQFSATAYHGTVLGSTPRTLFTLWRSGGEKTLSFWSSIQPEWLAGVSSLAGAVGQPDYNLLLLLATPVDLDQQAARAAERGQPFEPPAIPALPRGAAAFVPVGEALSPEEAAPIQALHDFYNANHKKLETEAATREAARAREEAERAAHPPVTQDTIIRFRVLSDAETR